MGQVIDFDEFRSEQEQEPVSLVVGGKTYNLPPALPAKIALTVIRLQRDLGPDVDPPAEELENMARGIFGNAIFDELMDEHRLTLDELSELMKRVLKVYNPGGSNRPNRAERRTKRPRRSRS